MNTRKAAKLANRRKLQGSVVCAIMDYPVPGKGPAREALFRNASKIMAGQGINVVGYWVPNEDPAWNDTFIYRVAPPGRDRAIFPQ